MFYRHVILKVAIRSRVIHVMPICYSIILSSTSEIQHYLWWDGSAQKVYQSRHCYTLNGSGLSAVISSVLGTSPMAVDGI